MQIRHLPPLLSFIPQFAQICFIFALSKFEVNPFFRPVKVFKRLASFYPEMILRPLFCFEDTKNIGLLILNSLNQKKLIFNFLVNRHLKNLTDSRKKAKILADNRKSHHPIETLSHGCQENPALVKYSNGGEKNAHQKLLCALQLPIMFAGKIHNSIEFRSKQF